TQSVFKTKGAGDGFRRLSFPSGGTTVFICPESVYDLGTIQVFEGASNKTAVFIGRKQEDSFSYPVPYIMWRGPGRIGQGTELADVMNLISEAPCGAIPSIADQPRAPWLSAPRKALAGLRKVMGASAYKAYAGCCTWLNGVYWMQIVEKAGKGLLLVQNMFDVGKIAVDEVTAAIEPDLIYPLLRGR